MGTNFPVRSREETEMWEMLFLKHRTGLGCSGLVIEGVQFFCEPHSDAKNPQYVREEDEWAAVETLEWHRKKFAAKALPKEFEGKFDSWQSWMMYLLTHVAKHYNVDKNTLLSHWTRHHMPTIIYEQTGEIWIPKPSVDETL